LGTLHRLADVIALLQDDEQASAAETLHQSPHSSASVSELTSVVLAVVAEKTGYPAEMLKPAMSLDHDLRIDSIKRVEILSALQERRPDLPAVKPEQLGTLHRLEDVIALLAESTAGTSAVNHQPMTSATAPSSVKLTVGIPRAVPLPAVGEKLKFASGAAF